MSVLICWEDGEEFESCRRNNNEKRVESWLCDRGKI